MPWRKEGEGTDIWAEVIGNERERRGETGGHGDGEAAMMSGLCLAYATVGAANVTIATNELAIQPRSSHQALIIIGVPGGQSRSVVPEKQSIGAIVKMDG